jgi:uncharacterized membrane protein (UPF0182 family)
VIVAFGDKVTMSHSIYDGIATLTKGDFQKKSPLKSSNAPAKSASKELTKKIIETYSKVKETLKRSDWASFGTTFESLDQLMDRLKKEQ